MLNNHIKYFSERYSDKSKKKKKKKVRKIFCRVPGKDCVARADRKQMVLMCKLKETRKEQVFVFSFLFRDGCVPNHRV